jgi:dolichyl-phosphate beta-glucosyltransferase
VRLPPYLCVIRKLFKQSGCLYEVIVVDDGSTDGMRTTLERSFHGWSELRIVQHMRNEGRGQAIRTGAAEAKGDLVLYADADGATPIQEYVKLIAAIDDGADVAVGSRVVQHAGVSQVRAIHRATISKIYRMLVKSVITVPAHDLMCGFKMWRRNVGRAVLDLCTDKGWLLDVEFLAMAQCMGYRIAEVPVNWSEISGSKVRLMRDIWTILPSLWKIRRSIRRMKSAQ